MLSQLIAPVVGIVVTTSASIAFNSTAEILLPKDMKPVVAFTTKIGVAVIGGLLAGRIAGEVTDRITEVVKATTPVNDQVVITPETD